MRARFAIGGLCLASLALAGCGKAPVVPSPFEVIGRTETNGVTALILRDTGTGCEMVAVPSVGLLPRNERSVDGLSVKQRCVITGDEQPTPANGAAAAAAPGGQTSTFAPAPNPVGSDAQEQAVREAIRSQAQGAIPPAGPAPAPTIPPPKGVTKTTPADDEDDGGGVESQLKK